jgi:hypothetical protein
MATATMACQVLAAIGYRTVDVPPPREKRWMMIARDHHLPMLVHEESGAGVELHHELVYLDFAHLLNAKVAAARALRRDRDGLHYQLLCPADRMMHNIIHAQIHHGLHRKRLVDLRQMIDLVLLIDRSGGDIDWLEIRDRFAKAGAAAVLRDQVASLREMFGRAVPIDTPDLAAAVTRLQHAIAKSLTAPTPTGVAILREIAADYWAGFRAHPLLAVNLLNPLWWPQRIRSWYPSPKR